MPSHVYLISDINVFVAQRGGLMGFGSRRVMGIGLPLMHAVTVQELKAIVAHEFGHYHSGDVALSPWIYKTRAAIARTMATLSKSVLRFIFAWYAHLFLRVTLAVSRRQEFTADQVAARAAGAAAMISGLRKVHAAAVAFRSYWHAELAPVFGAGYRPPVNAGFAQFLANRTVASQLQAEIAREEAQGATNPYDSHPSLRERVAALGPMPAGPAGDSRPAAALLADVASWEQKVIGAMSLDLAALKQVDWERVADVVYADAWRRLVAEHADLIRGKAVGTMSLARQDVLPLATALGAPADASDDARLQHASWFVTAAVGLAALRHGWKIEAPLGDEILLRRGDAVFRPSSEIAAVIG